VSDRYPTCCRCKSDNIEITEAVTGHRVWRYAGDQERTLHAEDIAPVSVKKVLCINCGKKMTESQIVWKDATP